MENDLHAEEAIDSAPHICGVDDLIKNLCCELLLVKENQFITKPIINKINKYNSNILFVCTKYDDCVIVEREIKNLSSKYKVLHINSNLSTKKYHAKCDRIKEEFNNGIFDNVIIIKELHLQLGDHDDLLSRCDCKFRF